MQDKFDINNYIDYFIFEIHIQNQDWYTGFTNIKYWRPQKSNGKWRYMLYDADQAFLNSGKGGFPAFNYNYVNFMDFVRKPYKVIENDTISRVSKHSELFNRIIMNNEHNYIDKCIFKKGITSITAHYQ